MSAAHDVNAEILAELRRIREALEQGNRDLLTRTDAARRLGMDRTELGRMVAAGTVRSVPYRNSTRIPREEVERLAREGLPQPKRRGRPRKPGRSVAADILAIPLPKRG